MTPKEAYKLSFKNRHLLVDDISCYYCIRYFKASEITEWADKESTGLCPHCSIDSLLPGIVDKDILIEAHNYWFTKE